MDLADLAQDRVEGEAESGITASRLALTGAGATVCTDCAEPIPAARRMAAPWAVRCIDCQHDKEAGGQG
jgi:phage/conjugal plasmid C-4 type zinc finger TraR family protein